MPDPNEGGKPWHDGASAEQIAYIEQKGWKGPLDVVGTAMGAEKLIGADRAGRTFTLPKDENDAEGLKAFRAKIGVPEKPEDYGTPESYKDDPLWGTVSAAAHKHGIPKAALLAFAEDVQKAARERNTASQAQAEGERTKAMDALKAKWGDKFDAHTELAKRALAKFGETAGFTPDEVKDFTAELESNPDSRRMFAAIAQAIGEDKFSGGDGGGGGDARAGAQAKLDELRLKRAKGELTDQQWNEQTAPLYALLSRAA